MAAVLSWYYTCCGFVMELQPPHPGVEYFYTKIFAEAEQSFHFHVGET